MGSRRDDRKAKVTKAGPGAYYVNNQEWQVGERYEVEHLLGSGSFSSVCRCLDTATGEQVAIKRIPDVLASPEQAKRVLREVAILRRLAHPSVIALRDAFTRPSATGGSRFIGGRLVPASIDAYLCMEYANGGDLFDLRGQLAAAEVRSLMAQILDGLRYLHAQSVWHRDLKSSNVLLAHEAGCRIIKIADLGSARSAVQEGYHWVEQPAPDSPRMLSTSPGRGAGGPRKLWAAAPHPAHMPHVDGSAPGGQIRMQDLYVQLGSREGPGACGLASPLTRMVATPCYRAPEVVMSRGGYTNAIDMWSAGCIFGELLQRVTYVGSAATPQLQVAPLFAIHGMPKTPASGDTYIGGLGNRVTRSELAALFDVIGTPTWADAEKVATPAWRHYLQNLPGKAPTLYRRMGAAGEPAVHLLSRLLHFDPAHRAAAAEALAHEYFVADQQVSAGGRQPVKPEALGRDLLAESGAAALAPSASVAIADGLQAMDLEESRRRQLARSPNTAPSKRLRFGSLAASASAGRLDPQNGSGGSAHRSDAADADMADGEPAPSASRSSFDDSERNGGATPDPAAALAAIEAETGDVSAGSSRATLARLRELLEREIDAQHGASLTMHTAAAALAASELRRTSSAGRLAGQGPGGGGDGRSWSGGGGLTGSVGRRERRYSFSEMRSWEGLQEDLGASTLGREATDFARGRLANVADTVDGKLDPAEYLKKGRHGEWTLASGLGPRGGGWGVDRLPPGVDPSDARMMAAIDAQQRR